MITKGQVTGIAERHMQGTDKYIVDVVVKTGNVITIVIDSDTSVVIDDCSHLSKAVEAALDRDQEDFELRVTSYGADRPLILKRQYTKNIGRQLVITKTDEQKIKGKLLKADETGITLELIPDKKKKDTPAETVLIAFAEIEQAKIVLSFK
ncbi:MAG: ribosome assembly cofactor RimP [Bacteroidales bacterium]|nr:ribosome assembly cofactor RimP [Bacteroidales bacterium]